MRDARCEGAPGGRVGGRAGRKKCVELLGEGAGWAPGAE